MEFDPGHLVQWAVQGGLTAIGVFALKILNDANDRIAEATDSIKELNVNVGRLFEKIDYHEKELSRLDTRLVRLELRDE